MQIRWEKAGWHLEEMDPIVLKLLREVPACAMLEDDAARARVFSSPTHGADPDADQDWREHVVPELAACFRSHVDIVAADLERVKTREGTASLQIPARHCRAWIHTLNQARLALAAKHDVTEEDIEGRRRSRSNARGYALLQIEFYGMLLGMILARTEF
jgi:hypothetical protein